MCWVAVKGPVGRVGGYSSQMGRQNGEDVMPCQPAARTPKPLSQCLEQDSRASHTQTHNPENAVQAQISAEGKETSCLFSGVVM